MWVFLEVVDYRDTATGQQRESVMIVIKVPMVGDVAPSTDCRGLTALSPSVVSAEPSSAYKNCRLVPRVYRGANHYPIRARFILAAVLKNSVEEQTDKSHSLWSST